MKQTTRLLGSLLCLSLLGLGCQPQTSPVQTQPTSPKPPASDLTSQTSASTYVPFTKAEYDAARAAGKPILLYFYASWCPFCREQEPRLVELFKTDAHGVAAFRVNYNDSDTDADERQLAKDFVVTYQHTFFFIGADGSVKKKIIGTLSDADVSANLDLIAN